MRSTEEMATFATIARRGSLSAAARSLGLAVSVVADRLKALEGRLGTPLLVRTTRRQTLTPAGAIYLAEIAPILEAIERLESRIRDVSSTPRGTLRVTAPQPVGRRWIAPFAGEFVSRYPDAKVHLALEDRYADIAGEGFDIAIRGGPFVESEFTGHFLFSSRRVLVASPAYLGAHGIPQTAEDLASHQCLVFNGGGHFHADWRFAKGERARTVRINSHLATTNSDLPLIWALAGLGITQKSIWEVQDHLAAGRLATIMEDDEPDPASFYAIHPVRTSQSRVLTLFIDELVTLVRNAFPR